MKLNISYPATGCQKVIDIEDEAKLRPFFDKRISHEVEGDALGDDFKGYVFKITGGNDKQGFPMLQGVLTANRVRLLFTEGMKCFRPRKRGERKRKSVRGCVVGSELSVLDLVVIKKGPQEIPGLTDTVKPRRLGPKRASRVRKLFNLTDKDDVRQYVIRRQIVPKAKDIKEVEGGEGEKPEKVIAPPNAKKPYQKAPKIQRLVTPQRLQRKRERKAIKKQRFEKSRKEAEEYNKLLAQRMKEKRAQREQKLAKKRSVSRAQSQSAGDAAKPAPAKAAAPAKPVDAKKAEPKKAEPKKAEPKKEDKSKKAEPKKAEPKKEDKSKKAEPKKAEPKKAEPKKEEPKKAAPAKEAPKAAAPKKEEPKKAEPKKEAKKEEPKKAEPKKAEPKAEQPKKDQAKKGGDKDQAKGKKK